MSGDAEKLKRIAAEAAIGYVESGMVLGLGTGSTVAHFLDLLAERLKAGALTDIVGVPTSVPHGAARDRAGDRADLARGPRQAST